MTLLPLPIEKAGISEVQCHVQNLSSFDCAMQLLLQAPMTAKAILTSKEELESTP
jgi:hypothetical protein